MKTKSRKLIILFCTILMLVASFNVNVYAKGKDRMHCKKYYDSSSFNLNKNQLNVIVNKIYEKNNTLYIDMYLCNETSVNFNDISDFNISFKDSKGNVFAQKAFKNLGVKGGLMPSQGKRLILEFGKDEYDIKGADLSKLSWNFTYNYR